MTCPLRSSPITVPSSLLRDNPPLCSVLGTLPLSSFSPYHQNDRFPRSINKPTLNSCHLYTGRRMVSNRMSSMLIQRKSKILSFDDIYRFFDTSSMVHLRSPLQRLPDTLTMPFLNRSLPRLFIKAALSGLKSASESRFRRAYLHLIYSSRS
jgi:hypothetical protein